MPNCNIPNVQCWETWLGKHYPIKLLGSLHPKINFGVLNVDAQFDYPIFFLFFWVVFTQFFLQCLFHVCGSFSSLQHLSLLLIVFDLKMGKTLKMRFLCLDLVQQFLEPNFIHML